MASDITHSESDSSMCGYTEIVKYCDQEEAKSAQRTDVQDTNKGSVGKDAQINYRNNFMASDRRTASTVLQQSALPKCWSKFKGFCRPWCAFS